MYIGSVPLGNLLDINGNNLKFNFGWQKVAGLISIYF
jgi:hypothetical protein